MGNRVDWVLGRIKSKAGTIHSHSSLKSYRECPHQWFGSYALGVKSPAGYATVFGKLVHEVSGAAAGLWASGEEVDGAALDRLVGEARSRLETAGPWEGAGLVPDTEEMRAAVAGHAEIAVRALEPLRDGLTGLETERAFLLPVGRGAGLDASRLGELEQLLMSGHDGDGYKRAVQTLADVGVDGIQAKVDLAVYSVPGDGTQVARIRDWKTDGNKPGSRTTRADVLGRHQEQVRLYGAIARRRLAGMDLAADVHALEFGEPMDVSLTTEEMNEAARAAGETINALRTSAEQGESGFAKQVGSACRFCHLAKARRDDGSALCPEGAAYRHERKWDTRDEEEADARLAADIEWVGDAFYKAKRAGQHAVIAAAQAMMVAAAEQAGAAPEGASEPETSVGQASDDSGLGNVTPVDPIQADVAQWTPEDAARAARDAQHRENHAAYLLGFVKEMRPYLQAYVELRGPIELPEGEDEPACKWQICSGGETTEWASVEEVEAALVAAGIDPSLYVVKALDTKALAVGMKDPGVFKVLDGLRQKKAKSPVLKCIEAKTKTKTEVETGPKSGGKGRRRGTDAADAASDQAAS